MAAPADPLNAAFTAETIKTLSVSGAAATFAAQAIKFVVQLGSRVALARLLDPRDFGLIAMVAPVLGFVQVLNDLGFAQAVVQRPEVTQKQVSALFWINALIGLGLTVLTVALAPLIAWLYGEPRTLAITAVLGSLIFLTSLSVLPAALLNRQLRFGPLAIADAGCQFVGVVAGLAAAWSGLGYWSLVLMQVGTSLSSLVILWCFTRWRPSWPRREAGIGSMVRFGANLMGSNMATYFSMSADNILVGVFGGPVALGLYDTSYNLVVRPLSQITAPVSRVAVPMLSRLVDVPERYAANYFIMIQTMLLAYLPGLVFAITLARPLLLLLLGTKWEGTIPVFGWIASGGLVAPLFASGGWLLTSQDRTKELMWVSTTTAVLSVISFALGIIWGVIGVAMLSAICFFFLQTPLLLRVATRSGPVSTRALVTALLPFAVATGVTVAALAALDTVRPDGIPGLVLLAAASYIVFLAAIICFPGGLTMLRRLLKLGAILRNRG
ncbi:MAG: lipopolysaccharide biosynthesis protein [Acetobacteraceae bacterium]|nr:lipopolysaccharide biosynthesis protein [Acetobacteraceae bacterium]